MGDGGGNTEYAHRLGWKIQNGELPDGANVLHRCDNPPCVRGSHLFLGTIADNNADMKAKGRKFTKIDLGTARVIREMLIIGFSQ